MSDPQEPTALHTLAKYSAWGTPRRDLVVVIVVGVFSLNNMITTCCGARKRRTPQSLSASKLCLGRRQCSGTGRNLGLSRSVRSGNGPGTADAQVPDVAEQFPSSTSASLGVTGEALSP